MHLRLFSDPIYSRRGLQSTGLRSGKFGSFVFTLITEKKNQQTQREKNMEREKKI